MLETCVGSASTVDLLRAGPLGCRNAPRAWPLQLSRSLACQDSSSRPTGSSPRSRRSGPRDRGAPVPPHPTPAIVHHAESEVVQRPEKQSPGLPTPHDRSLRMTRNAGAERACLIADRARGGAGEERGCGVVSGVDTGCVHDFMRSTSDLG